MVGRPGGRKSGSELYRPRHAFVLFCLATSVQVRAPAGCFGAVGRRTDQQDGVGPAWRLYVHYPAVQMQEMTQCT